MTLDMAIAPVTGSGIYLQPGDIRFFIPAPGILRPPRLHTLLGSCVSVILWHPERKIGGMSHMILPECGRRQAAPKSDGRYCDGAVALFRREVLRAATQPSQYLVYLVGGGRMYDSLTVMEGQTVGERNIEAARSHLRMAGFRAPVEDAGEEGYRKVELDLARGTVTVLAGTRRRILSVG